MQRRGFLGAILAAGFAPAAIGSGVLMPVRQLIVPAFVPGPLLLASNTFLTTADITREALMILEQQASFLQLINREWPRQSVIKIQRPRSYLQRSGA